MFFCKSNLLFVWVFINVPVVHVYYRMHLYLYRYANTVIAYCVKSVQGRSGETPYAYTVESSRLYVSRPVFVVSLSIIDTGIKAAASSMPGTPSIRSKLVLLQNEIIKIARPISLCDILK